MPIVYRRRDRLKGTETEELIGQAIREEFATLGDKIVASLKERAPKDQRKFEKSIKHRPSGRGLATRMRISAGAKHAEYVEKGRPKGKKPPPFNAIFAWVRRRGYGASAFSVKTRRAISAGTRRSFNRKEGKLRTRAQSLLQIQKGFAIYVQKKIAKDGIEGKFYFRDMKSYYASEISRIYSRAKVRIAQLLNS